MIGAFLSVGGGPALVAASAPARAALPNGPRSNHEVLSGPRSHANAPSRRLQKPKMRLSKRSRESLVQLRGDRSSCPELAIVKSPKQCEQYAEQVVLPFQWMNGSAHVGGCSNMTTKSMISDTGRMVTRSVIVWNSLQGRESVDFVPICRYGEYVESRKLSVACAPGKNISSKNECEMIGLQPDFNAFWSSGRCQGYVSRENQYFRTEFCRATGNKDLAKEAESILEDNIRGPAEKLWAARRLGMVGVAGAQRAALLMPFLSGDQAHIEAALYSLGRLQQHSYRVVDSVFHVTNASYYFDIIVTNAHELSDDIYVQAAFRHILWAKKDRDIFELQQSFTIALVEETRARKHAEEAKQNLVIAMHGEREARKHAEDALRQALEAEKLAEDALWQARRQALWTKILAGVITGMTLAGGAAWVSRQYLHKKYKLFTGYYFPERVFVPHLSDWKSRVIQTGQDIELAETRHDTSSANQLRRQLSVYNKVRFRSGHGADGADKFTAGVLISGRLVHAALGLKIFLKIGQDLAAQLVEDPLKAIRQEFIELHRDLGQATILEVINYILDEPAVEREEPSNDGSSMQVRDKGNSGLRLVDFCAFEAAVKARLKVWHVASIRIYTSLLFQFLNKPFRDPANRDGFQKTHPLPATMFFLDEALRMLRSVHASDPKPNAPIEFWRGLKDMDATEDFLRNGGTELACMSTSTDSAVVGMYALSQRPLLLRIKVSSFMAMGADISAFSLYASEKEVLFPPLTYLKPLGTARIRGYPGMIVDVEPQI